jgi:hypothetical protein
MARDTAALVAAFADAVVRQSECIMEGDARTGNRHAHRQLKAFDELAEIGDAGREALCVLLRHDRPDVRTAAACWLLRYRHAEARAVLEREAKGRGLTALEASECLKRWEEGAWQLDLED